jgi:uncharacterized protein YlxW (UPF0749 family)
MQKLWEKPILIFTIIACITGFILMVSFRSYTPTTDSSDYDARHKSIIAYINQLEDEISSLEDQISATRTEISKQQKLQTTDADTHNDLQTIIGILNDKAGYTEVSGPGIMLTLDDNNAGATVAQKNSTTYNPEDYIIHDSDILYITRAVADIADAISINGQRLVDSSNIRCVGSVIMVNASRLAPPYEISIVGDPEALIKTIKASDEYINLKSINMPVKISAEENVIIPAFNGSNTPNYAHISQ